MAKQKAEAAPAAELKKTGGVKRGQAFLAAREALPNATATEQAEFANAWLIKQGYEGDATADAQEKSNAKAIAEANGGGEKAPRQPRGESNHQAAPSNPYADLEALANSLEAHGGKEAVRQAFEVVAQVSKVVGGYEKAARGIAFIDKVAGLVG